MSAYTPSASWHWLVTDQLQLDTGVAVQSTPFLSHQLIALEETHFTVEQAQYYWIFWYALEQLQLDEAACFAATVDALCCQQFVRQSGHKSWGFSPVSQQYQPVIAELVFLAGRVAMLAIVTNSYGASSQLLLLDSGENLQGKQLLAGQVMVVLNDRLQPALQQKPTPQRHFAKSA
jgi:FMN phosphatase YigB (HAD superfamily)